MLQEQDTPAPLQPNPPKTMEAHTTGGTGRVILASVSQIMYPVDLDLIHHLFSRYGEVEKIVSFYKTPTLYQALVQFARPEQAQEALANLHNRNIYDGCNTLQLQESRLPELVVKSNCAKSWDYTISAAGPGASRASLLEHHPQQQPQHAVHPEMHHHPQAAARGMFTPYGGVRPVPHPPVCFPPERLPQELREMDFDFANPSQTPVVIVYNIPASVNIQMPLESYSGVGVGCAKSACVFFAFAFHSLGLSTLRACRGHPPFLPFGLFNLFSLYGIVLRIKILKERPDTALIQYALPFYATIAQCLMMGAVCEGQALQVTLSRNKEVRLPSSAATASGHSTGVEDEKRTVAFNMKDQRYGGEDVEKYVKGACRPTKTVFVANVNEEAQAEDVAALFKQYGQVLKITFKKPKNETSRTKLCIMEFESEERVRLLRRDALLNLLHSKHARHEC
ncbi:RNA recognition motif-containing protein [Cyclospora cayetanensis]|uniref:RNA recognition motif-containing protein n=1 Tax=Cyclospora cayetanensis TaxID=88456 RepID=A0A1D3CXZ0_9EIME|nr:RNA recognition motif-containing protein [Cyclospora cayetanensis]